MKRHCHQNFSSRTMIVATLKVQVHTCSIVTSEGMQIFWNILVKITINIKVDDSRNNVRRRGAIENSVSSSTIVASAGALVFEQKGAPTKFVPELSSSRYVSFHALS